MKKCVLFFLFLISLLVFLSNADAFRFEATERQITNHPAEQTRPAVSGSIIVWTDYRNGNTDIYLYDLKTDSEIQVTSDMDNQYLSDVSGNIVVFTTYRADAANEEIFAYDISTGQIRNITNHWADQRNPSISGNKVVFQDSRNRTREDIFDLFLINLQTDDFLPVVEHLGTQVNPHISGNLVVWEDLRSGTDLDIYMKDLVTGEERLVAGGPGNQRFPHIDGDIIVYNNGNHDIDAYRISTGETFPITRTPEMERIPVVSGDYVAFERVDQTNVDADIWIYSLSLGVEVQATIDPANQYLQDLDGNRLVYVDDRNGNLDIYLMEFNFYVQDIEVSPLTYDFGEVEVGGSSSTVIKISNVGNNQLTVNMITVMSGWCGDLSISYPEVPFILNPGETTDVNVTFNPSSVGTCSGMFEIFSDDHDEFRVEVSLTGTGFRRGIPPEEEIENILEFFDESVENGSLVGSGPGKSASNRLNALRNMLVAAGGLIEAGDISGACTQLMDAYKKTDGQPRPPDLVVGEAASVLAAMIQHLMGTLRCE